jgi:hypothetical protein
VVKTMRSLVIKLFVLLLSAVLANRAAVLCYDLFCRPSGVGISSSVPAFRVYAIPESLDFGEVWESEAFPWQVELENRASERVVIDELKGSCSCISTNTSEISLNPGEHRQVDFIINLADNRPYDTNSSRDVRIQLSGRVSASDGSSLIHTWYLRGRVKRYLISDPTALAFGEIVVDGSGEQKRVGITSRIPLRSLRIAAAPPGWQVTATRVELPPGDFALTVTAVGTSPGVFRETVKVQGVSENGEFLPPLTLRCSGAFRTPVYALPQTQDLGVVSGSEVRTITFTLINDNASDCEIGRIVLAHDDASVLKKVQTPSGWEVTFRQATTGKGAQTVEHVVFIQHREKEFPVHLRYTWYVQQ